MTTTFVTECSPFKTLRDFLRFGVSQATSHGLTFGHGTDNAVDDIYSLLLGTLSLPAEESALWLDARLTEAEKVTIAEQLSARILKRIPVPYLINQAYFCGLPFYVDNRVLIPRSPIGELIKREFTPWIEPSSVHRILELCTGSGCIAIACHYAFPDATIDATDISPAALAVAAINGEKHNIDDELLHFIAADVFEGLKPARYDVIIANPPYVGDSEMASLPAEYLHEPDIALRAQRNGLAIVERILSQAHEFLTENGILIVEVGNSEEALVDALPHLPFTWLDFEYGGQGVFLLTREQLLP